MDGEDRGEGRQGDPNLDGMGLEGPGGDNTFSPWMGHVTTGAPPGQESLRCGIVQRS